LRTREEGIFRSGRPHFFVKQILDFGFRNLLVRPQSHGLEGFSQCGQRRVGPVFAILWSKSLEERN